MLHNPKAWFASLGSGLGLEPASPRAAGSVHGSLHVQSRVVSEEPVCE